jgi:hypothetical protein
MKAKNKGETEKFAQNKRLIYATIAIITIIILASIFFYIHPNQPSQPKAAIIDQLSSSQLAQAIRHPNQTFIATAKELLFKRFSIVDYYSDNATVDQYKNLASVGYKLIIWRAHSALDLNSKYIAISTSDKYGSKNYGQYLENGQLTVCNITGYYYFGITPKFVEELMGGRFEDTVIIFMSCNGLKQGYYKTAETFEKKGVKVFISWDGWIDPSDNDHATALLLDYLINKNNTINEAVGNIPQYSSPLYGLSKLNYYPLEVGNYHIPNYKQTNIANKADFVAIVILRKIKTKVINYESNGFRLELSQTDLLNASGVSKHLSRAGFGEDRLLG